MNTVKIDRREFLKKGLSLGLTAGGVIVLGKTDFLLGQETLQVMPDLVTVKNGEPDAMFKKAISLMGGMEQFVKKGQTVVVKPNICGPYRPEFAATTNPTLIKTICECCFQVGAKKVYVFDNVSSPSTAARCYKSSGIEDAVESAGATMVPGAELKYYKEVDLHKVSKLLSSAHVHETILDSDVFINVPILKHHNKTHLTMAMKNLMGVIHNRRVYHFMGLDQCIANFCRFRKPDLNVVDAYRVIMRGGPSAPAFAEDIELKKTLLLSRDIAAVDAAAAIVFGMKPKDVEHIAIGHRQKTGNMNLNELKMVTYSMEI